MSVLGKLLRDPWLILGLIAIAGWSIWTLSAKAKKPPLEELEACIEQFEQAVRIERRLRWHVRDFCDQDQELDPINNPCLSDTPRSKADRARSEPSYTSMTWDLKELRETYPEFIQARKEIQAEKRKRWEGREDEFERLTMEATLKTFDHISMNPSQIRKRPIYINQKGLDLVAKKLTAARADAETRSVLEQADQCARAIL